MRYREILEAIDDNETDKDLFGASSSLATGAKQAIKQIEDPYLRTVRTIRELAKTRYGAKIRVSGAPKKSARGRATVWVGDYDANYQIPKTTPEAFRVKEDLEQMGFECRFTDAGWLSVKVPPVFSNLISEESDDELFGSVGHPHGKDIAHDLSLWLQRRQSGSRRPIMPSSEKYVQEVIAAFNRNWIDGIRTWSEYPLYGNTDIKYDIREYFEQTRNVNFMDYVGQVDESDESDNELFGQSDQVLTRKIAAIARTLKPRRVFEPVAEEFDESLEAGLGAFNDMGYNDWTMDLAGTVSERLGVDLFDLWKNLDESEESDDELFGHHNTPVIRLPNGRAVNKASIRVGNVNSSDYPDFTDAYVEDATFRDGTPLDDQELVELTDLLADSGELHELIWDSLHESEESDDDLFGDDGPIRRALKLLILLKPAVKENPYAIRDIIEKNKWEDPAQVKEKIYDFMAQALGMTREYFDHQGEDLAMLPVRENWNRPWEFWDVKTLNRAIKTIAHFKSTQ